MAGEFQNLGYAIKTVYPSKALEAVINEETPFRAKLKKEIPAGGRVTEGTVKFNGVLATPQNVAQIVDGDDLQTAAERSEVQFTLNPTIFQATMQIGWLTRKTVNSSKSGFNGGEVRRRTEETASNLGKFIESTYVGSLAGIRAYVDSATAAGIVLKQPEGVKLLRQGMKISVINPSGYAARTGLDAVRIATVAPSTLTIYTSASDANAIQDDYVVVVNKASLASISMYANSIRSLIDDGTNGTYIHGVDRTTAANIKLKSTVVTSTALRDLTEGEMLRTVMTVRENTGKRITDILYGPGMLEKWIAIVAPDRSRVVSGGSYDKSLGIKSEDELVLYAPGAAVRGMLSFDVIPREMYYINWDSWFHYVAQEMQWVDDDQLLHLTVGSSTYKAGWSSFMASFENIGCDMPAANAVARNLKDATIGDA